MIPKSFTYHIELMPVEQRLMCSIELDKRKMLIRKKLAHWLLSDFVAEKNQHLTSTIVQYLEPQFINTVTHIQKLEAQIKQLHNQVQEQLIHQSQASTEIHPEDSGSTTANTSANPCPSILLVTLPKSASVFIFKTLQEGLQLRQLMLSYGYFPQDNLSTFALEEMQQGGTIGQTHADASPHNLQRLEFYNLPIVVHFRDPRSALLSWAHHLKRLAKEGHLSLLQMVSPAPQPTLFEQDFNVQLAWHIKHYFPSLIQWISAWVDAVDHHPYGKQIHLTTYKEFLTDQDQYFCRLLKHCGIPPEHFTPPDVPKTMDVHFRKGDPNEWREVMPIDFQRHLTNQIPPAWFERFNWER